ncbi:MAG: sigma-70 family RNA polymerase sigma factor [Paludibacter sp.]|nr:sigma-70 family RNA polymerase sigma factor [Paludibacter sp.]
MQSWLQFKDKPTIELIKQIQKRTDPKEISFSESAFHAFVFRFEGDVTKKAEVICGSWGFNIEETIEIVQNVFKKFWRYPKFNVEKKKEQNLDKAVILYLYGIARNELTDYFNKKNGLKLSPYDGSEELVYDLPEMPILDDQADYNVDVQLSKIRLKAIKAALETLSEKHKIIYLTYSSYEYSGKKLPRELLCKLREELGVNQATIRSYKKDVSDKIKEYLTIYESYEA